MVSDLQSKVRELYDFIRQDLYLCQDDLFFGATELNSTLLFGLLTQLNRGKMLVFGEYGGGKTTSAEYIHSLSNSLPLDLIRQVVLRGDPQRVRETMVGRPHYGKLHGEEEVAVWKQFVLVGPKVLDEFNRIVEGNQSIVLDGVDRGIWECMDQFINTGPQPFTATCNYADDGNFALIPPMLDRFNIAVESSYPGVAEDNAISDDFHNDKDRLLLNPDLTERAIRLFQNSRSYEEIAEGLERISQDYQRNLDSEGIPVMTAAQRDSAGGEISALPLSKDALTYFLFLAAELNVSAKHGMKRSMDRPSNENGNYLEACFSGSGSRRTTRSIKQYAKSLAWFQGRSEVSLEHVMAVAPYALWHRVKWSGEVRSAFNDATRNDPLNLHIAKLLCNGGTDTYPGVKKRALESGVNYHQLCSFVANEQLREAREFASKCGQEGKGHPIFIDASRSLGRRPSEHFLRLAETMANEIIPNLPDRAVEPIVSAGPVTGYISGNSYAEAINLLQTMDPSELPTPYHNLGSGALHPLTGKKSIEALLRHHVTDPSTAGEFTQKGFDTVSALVVNAATRQYKVVPYAEQLLNGVTENGEPIKVDFDSFDVPAISYDEATHNQALSYSNAKSHPGWRQFFEGEEGLLLNFVTLAFGKTPDASTTKMAFILPEGDQDYTMLYPIYVQGSRNDFRLTGNQRLNTKTNFLLLGKES